MKPRSRALERTAYHEAGHVVAAHRRGLRVECATILPGVDHNAAVQISLLKADVIRAAFGELGQELFESQVIACLAGPEAARKLRGRYDHIGARQDRGYASYLVRNHYRSASPFQLRLRFTLLTVLAEQLVSERWCEIALIASALIEQTTLRRSRIVRLLASESKTKEKRQPCPASKPAP